MNEILFLSISLLISVLFVGILLFVYKGTIKINNRFRIFIMSGLAYYPFSLLSMLISFVFPLYRYFIEVLFFIPWWIKNILYYRIKPFVEPGCNLSADNCGYLHGFLVDVVQVVYFGFLGLLIFELYKYCKKA